MNELTKDEIEIKDRMLDFHKEISDASLDNLLLLSSSSKKEAVVVILHELYIRGELDKFLTIKIIEAR